MPKVTSERYNPENGVTTKTIDISGGPDAANPTDDFDSELNMRKIVALNAKVAKLRDQHERAKKALKDTAEAERVTKSSELLKAAVIELDGFLEEMGREYPLFR